MAKLSNSSSTTTHPRKSYLLSVKPVEYSLTEGTNIPAPDHTPPRSPAPDIAPPPTPGRGPLNSHPTTTSFDDASDMDVDTPETSRERENGHRNGNPAPAARVMTSDNDGASSFKTPTSPASAAQNYTTSSSPQAQARRPSGVRKLLSLSNLRSSFSSSRTSLAIPRSSHDTTSNSTYNPSLKRPGSPSMYSTTASSIAPSQHLQQSGQQQPPPLRSRKSGGNWFKRKSGLFLLNNSDELDSVAEDGGAYRPDTRESKRQKPLSRDETAVHRVPERKASPPPLIPEIGSGSFSGGDLGWDEAAFRR